MKSGNMVSIIINELCFTISVFPHQLSIAQCSVQNRHEPVH